MMKNKRIEKKVNAIVDEILDEDQENDFSDRQLKSSKDCPKELNNPPKETSRQCKCGVENSMRFSLRVLEALRLLQRDVDQSSTSSINEIVNYIRANYHHDGDLYSQVQTALRQVCSQGFVMELKNEYHLIGPVVNVKNPNPNGCSFGCKGHTSMYDTSKRRKNRNNYKNDVCRCKRFFKRNKPQNARPSCEKSLGKTLIDRDENLIAKPRFHSRISVDERNNADYQDIKFDTEKLPSCDCNDTLDIRDNDRQCDITGRCEIERRYKYTEPIPGPSKGFMRTLSPTPTRKAKEARLEERIMQRTDENDETTEEEDMNCTCDTNGITRNEQSKRRLDRTRILTKDQRNKQRHENNEEDEDEEDEEKTKEEDENTEDSAYRELRMRNPHKKNAAHERELKRWIRQCRQECERRRTQ